MTLPVEARGRIRGRPRQSGRGSLRGRLAVLMGIAVLAVVAIPATAMGAVHEYCSGTIGGKGTTCPPSGSSEWHHLLENDGAGTGINAEICIDEYLDPSGTGHYTGASCIASNGKYVIQYPGETWGYPRLWVGAGVPSVSGVEVWFS